MIKLLLPMANPKLKTWTVETRKEEREMGEDVVMEKRSSSSSISYILYDIIINTSLHPLVFHHHHHHLHHLPYLISHYIINFMSYILSHRKELVESWKMIYHTNISSSSSSSSTPPFIHSYLITIIIVVIISHILYLII